MENVMNVAAYMFKRYHDEYGMDIDEMKLHKLLYFAQRESLIQTDMPLFEADFHGWKYGPVLKEIRGVFKEERFSDFDTDEIAPDTVRIIDRVFDSYAKEDSWSLSRLTHSELSWKNSREGIAPGENGDNRMKLDDIRQDAQRIRTRRARLELMRQLGLIQED